MEDERQRLPRVPDAADRAAEMRVTLGEALRDDAGVTAAVGDIAQTFSPPDLQAGVPRFTPESMGGGDGRDVQFDVRNGGDDGTTVQVFLPNFTEPHIRNGNGIAIDPSVGTPDADGWCNVAGVSSSALMVWRTVKLATGYLADWPVTTAGVTIVFAQSLPAAAALKVGLAVQLAHRASATDDWIQDAHGDVADTFVMGDKDYTDAAYGGEASSGNRSVNTKDGAQPTELFQVGVNLSAAEMVGLVQTKTNDKGGVDTAGVALSNKGNVQFTKDGDGISANATFSGVTDVRYATSGTSSGKPELQQQKGGNWETIVVFQPL